MPSTGTKLFLSLSPPQCIGESRFQLFVSVPSPIQSHWWQWLCCSSSSSSSSKLHLCGGEQFDAQRERERERALKAASSSSSVISLSCVIGSLVMSLLPLLNSLEKRVVTMLLHPSFIFFPLSPFCPI